MSFQQKGMTVNLKDYLLLIGFSFVTLFVIIAVLMGLQAIVIDTGRAILR